jgi:8-oxo-dGTP pyrophosphatase MutT (NUDIX family)
MVVVKQRRLAAANSKWRVFLDHLTDGHGNEVPDYLVIEGHQTRPDSITGVTVLPIVERQFVLLRVYRHALASKSWEAPRGFVDPDESPEDAALRELAEETGLTCAREHLVALGHYAPEASTMKARGALFAASRCQGVPRAPETEIGIESVEFIDTGRLERLIDAGEIEDAGTLLAYFRYRRIPITAAR